MSKWNSKVRCIEAFDGNFIKGDVYEVKSGHLVGLNGYAWKGFVSIESLNSSMRSKFEEVLDIPQPHRSLLKSGMKIVYRNGEERYVFLQADILMDEFGNRGNRLSYYSDDMLFETCKTPFDIMEIYSEDGELIAKREEKSAKDIKIEELEKRMRDLADEIGKLKDSKN